MARTVFGIALVICATVAAVNAQSLQDQCEASGGTWSECASACPLTCDTPPGPVLCPAVCVVGCVCPVGMVFQNGQCIDPEDCGGKSPSSPAQGLTQEMCECSGGTWSDCASPCPTTCENLGDLIACPALCVTGCTCPQGFVQDPIYGCKEESFCQPTFCCLAFTAGCLACAAGVPVDLYCKVNQNVIGCPTPDPCATVDCAPGFTCESVVNPCFVPPCPVEAQCVPESPQLSPPLSTCDNLDCEAGSSCQLVEPPCAGPLPCPPVPTCVCDELPSGDANGDGVVTVNDVVLASSFVLNGTPIPKCIAPLIELTGDEVFNIADIVQIINLIIGA